MKTKPTYQELERKLENQKLSNDLLDKSLIVRFIWRNLKGWPVDYVSNNVVDIFGYSQDDFITNKIIYRSIIHKDDLDRVIKESILNIKSRTNSFVYSPYRIINKTGDIIWVKEISLVKTNSEGEITHFEGVITDITEYTNSQKLNKLKNEELEINRELVKDKNNLFQTTLDAIDALVYVSDFETYEILSLNRYGREIFGDKIGQKCYEVLQRGRTSPCEFCTNHLLVDEKGKANSPYIWEFQNTIDKKWYQCRDQAIEWESGKLVRIEIATDITQNKESEILLLNNNEQYIKLNNELIIAKEISEKNELRYKSLFESNPISLWEEDFSIVKLMLDEKVKQVADIELYLNDNPSFVKECASKIKILSINQRTLDLFAVEKSENLIKHISKSFNEKSLNVFKKELIAIANNAQSFEQETEFVDFNGKLINAIISYVAITDYDRVIVSIIEITEIKRIEKELKLKNLELFTAKHIAEENEERFWKIFENMPSGVAVYRPINDGEDFEFVNVNKKAEFITKASREKLIGKTLLHEFPLMIKQPLYSALQKVNNTGKDLYIPPFFYKDIEREGWRENYIYKLSSGEIVAIFKDVTDVKNAEEKLKSNNEELKNSKIIAEINEKKYRLILSNTKDTIWTTNLDFKLTYCNNAIKDLLGYNPEEVIGKDTSLLSTAESINKLRRTAEYAINAYKKNSEIIQSVTTIKQIKKDKTIIDSEIRSNLLLDENDVIIGFQGRTVDITKQKNIERELSVQNIALKEAIEKSEISEFRFKSLIENAPDGVIIIDKLGRFNYTSPYSSRFFGYDIGEIIGKNSRHFIHSDDIMNVAKTIRMVYHDSSLAPVVEYRFKRKDGTYRWIEGKFTNLLNNKGVNGLVVNYTDITESKKLIEELIVSKKRAEESDNLKTEFINNMSHEIRTPMNGILGFSDLLTNNNLSPDKQMQYVQIIQNSGNHLLRIIDDILEISRLGTKQVKTYNKEICLNNVLLEQFSIFGIKAKENNIPLYLKKGLPDSRSKILADENKLTKILSNLLENALKFTYQGYIEFGYYLDIKAESTQVVIYVKDTGIGIKAESQKVIFERFSQEEKELTQKVSGLGLGLSIAKENAELLGGSITLESEKNKGTTFFVRIPYNRVVSEDYSSNEGNANDSLEEKSGYNVLIVEDEDVNFLFIDTLLETYNLNITTIHAKNGAEAVELCRNNDDIDFILMDLKMPILNGYDATKQIKAFLPNMPIVAQTAYSTNEDRNKALNCGCIDFISKPIDNLTLRGIIGRYLINK